jgi:hypothetical protein
LKQRRLHKAFLRYHDAENWPLLREALKNMGRADLIGPGQASSRAELAAASVPSVHALPQHGYCQ